jgi:outer membrane protein TolC
LGVASRELGQVLGRPPQEMPSVRAPRPDEEREPTEADSSRWAEGVLALPDVRLAAEAKARADLDEADAEHRKAMRVDGSADAGLAGTDLTHAVPPDVRADDPNAGFGNRLRRDLGASASVTFTRPLLDGTTAPALEARKAAANAAGLQLAATSDAQRRAARDLFDRWRSAVRRLRAEEDIVARAETSLLRIRSLYVAGSAGILDVLDAHRTLDDAREQVADARAESRALAVEAEARS